jgi:hypothetical protein
MCPTNTAGQPDLTDVVRVLLDHGFDPNQTIASSTVWGIFMSSYLGTLEAIRDSDDCYVVALNHLSLIELLISRGANPNVEVLDSTSSSSSPAWGRLLLAMARQNLSRNTALVYPKTIDVFLRAGADPNFGSGWLSKSIWQQFLQHIESRSNDLAEIVRLEFLAKVACSMLLHGAQPAALSVKVVKDKFPSRFSERILEILGEKSLNREYQHQNGSKKKSQSWSLWSWFYPWSA